MSFSKHVIAAHRKQGSMPQSPGFRLALRLAGMTNWSVCEVCRVPKSVIPAEERHPGG
jgi:hypothetical protein